MSEHHMGDFDEGWDNYRFVEMRENMLAGKWNLNQDFPDSPPHVDYVKKGGQLTRTADCSNCYNKEMRGLQSQRQNWLRNMVNMLPNGTYESANKTTGNDIIHLNLNLSNICNFKCRMCSPNYSNSLIPDFNHLLEVGSPVRRFKENLTKKIIDVDHILEQYGPQLSKLNTIWVTGGEPFMDDRLYEFIEKLSNYTDITQLRVFVTTNGSKIDINKLDKFDSLKTININLSVDATGDLFTYMRSAGVMDWSQVEQLIADLRDWQSHERHPGQRQLSYNASFQTYNSYNTAEFYRYFRSILGKHDWIEYRMLTSPVHLAVQHMPERMKTAVGRQLQAFHDSIDHKRDQQSIRNLIQSLTTPRHLKFWDQFIKFTVDLDHYRGQYLVDYAPDLYSDFDNLTKRKFELLYAQRDPKTNRSD